MNLSEFADYSSYVSVGKGARWQARKAARHAKRLARVREYSGAAGDEMANKMVDAQHKGAFKFGMKAGLGLGLGAGLGTAGGAYVSNTMNLRRRSRE